MSNCKEARTPLPAGAVLEASKETASDTFRTQYQSVIGSIMYTMLGTRPDIAFAVMRLAKYASNPSKQHMRYAQYILRYLQGTKDFVLCYDGDLRSGLIAYSDSDWAEDRDDRHSTTGFIFMLANCVVAWVSRRQTTVSLSSTEAEYKAADERSESLPPKSTNRQLPRALASDPLKFRSTADSRSLLQRSSCTNRFDRIPNTSATVSFRSEPSLRRAIGSTPRVESVDRFLTSRRDRLTPSTHSGIRPHSENTSLRSADRFEPTHIPPSRVELHPSRTPRGSGLADRSGRTQPLFADSQLIDRCTASLRSDRSTGPQVDQRCTRSGLPSRALLPPTSQVQFPPGGVCMAAFGQPTFQAVTLLRSQSRRTRLSVP